MYLEWDCPRFQEKALNAVTLANKVGCVVLFSSELKQGACIQQQHPNSTGMHKHVWAVLEDKNPCEI